MLTVIVADDEKIARRRLVRLIEETGEAEVVAACAGGREAVEQTTRAAAAACSSSTCRCPISTASACCSEFGRQGVAGDGVRHRVRPIRRASVRRARCRLSAQAVRHDALSRSIRSREGAAQPGAAARADDERMRALLADYVATTQPDVAATAARSRCGQSRRRSEDRSHGGRRLVGDRRQLHSPARRRRSHLIRMTAASIEPQLDPRSFIRIHRRYIVNVDRIVEVQPWFAGDAIMVLRNGAKLRSVANVSRAIARPARRAWRSRSRPRVP